MMELPPIPEKEFFSIGELSAIAQLPAYVLRYWESEFKFLRPARRNSGQRKYVRQDIETVFLIKDLLYNKKFTIAGARKHILAGKRKNETAEPVATLNVELPSDPKQGQIKSILSETKKELEDILKLLNK